ncbi:MAG TPA: DUF6064 family protein [Pseudolabrys sp.]|nr:DUF6064 family protein [Pseudolabrys sp.]
MSEWWTYTPSDFLLFSPRVYYRMFELYNRSLWPLAIVSLACGLAILWLLLNRIRGGDRLIAALLGLVWIWIAWEFFWNRYADINWASVYVAPLFALQGVALLSIGALAGRIKLAPQRRAADMLAVALFCFSLIGYPFVAPLSGRSTWAAEIFGLAPDPTALATLALLAMSRDGGRWALMIVPAVWCLATGLTLWTMQAAGFFVAPAGALTALLIAAIAPSHTSVRPAR